MILFYVLALAFIYLITESWILRPIRVYIGWRFPLAFRVLVYCPACTGFWVGAVMGWWHPLDEDPAARIFTSAMSTMVAGAVWSRWFAQSPFRIENDIIEELLQETPDHDSPQATETTETEGH